MTVTRRNVLGMGGGLVAALSVTSGAAWAGTAVEIRMGGRKDGSRVWFDPVGLLVEPGQTIGWVNDDAGNSHTATAYHPDNFDRPLRIPAGAAPWDSDFLLPGESFAVTLLEPGVYDYYCVPHEHAGMVGRIIVGSQRSGWAAEGGMVGDVPEIALKAFPTVEEIMSKGVVRRI